ncbi:hypothetical protein OG352_38885 [Streptomyces sp. NBC_01485]|uniref:hypothetical protein n=1 Tax=Streptomyces sp. NBC_01485 TaxID=2903884 RepID=UPI002E37B5B0|nr:hypothetical protein [Streptomyces sp. NBC_01485]
MTVARTVAGAIFAVLPGDASTAYTRIAGGGPLRRDRLGQGEPALDRALQQAARQGS